MSDNFFETEETPKPSENDGWALDDPDPVPKAPAPVKSGAQAEEKPFTKEEQTIVLKSVGRAITNEPTRFDIDIRPYNKVHAWLQRQGLKGVEEKQTLVASVLNRLFPAKRYFEVYPLCIGCMTRVSMILFDINYKFDPQGNEIRQALDIISKNGAVILEAIALGIQNKQARPSKELIRFLRRNLGAGEMLTLLTIVISRMDVNAFIQSTVLMGSLHVLQPSENASDKTGPAT